MTIAEAKIELQIALPQGWTKEEIEERLNEAVERLFENENFIVEHEATVIAVNADPFGIELSKRLKQIGKVGSSIQFPSGLPTFLGGSWESR